MKVSREQAEANRARVIEIASHAFQSAGLEGVSIADIMKQSGLTHGGFYGAFDSKAALAREAYELARTRARAVWSKRAEAGETGRLEALVAPYLSAKHRDNPGAGCAHAALATDVARSDDPKLRRAFTAGIRDMIEALTRAGAQHRAKARRRRAIAQVAAMIGALVVARAIDDEALSDEVLTATRQEICA